MGVSVGAGIVVGVDMAGLVVHYSTSAHDKWEIEDDNRIPESQGIPGIGGNWWVVIPGIPELYSRW